MGVEAVAAASACGALAFAYAAASAGCEGVEVASLGVADA